MHQAGAQILRQCRRDGIGVYQWVKLQNSQGISVAFAQRER